MRDWNTIGIGWMNIAVAEQAGPHATDKRDIGNVESPQALDIDKMVAHFGAQAVVAMLNHSSSFDVRARAWYKSAHKRDAKGTRNMETETMREAVYTSVLRNVSSRGGVRVERQREIVIGTWSITIKAGDEINYATVFGAALAAAIDANPNAPVDFLRTFVASSLESAGIVADAEVSE